MLRLATGTGAQISFRGGNRPMPTKNYLAMRVATAPAMRRRRRAMPNPGYPIGRYARLRLQ